MIKNIINYNIVSICGFFAFTKTKEYEFIVWINQNIFLKLENSPRLEVYIGVLGILIAIVIFIAELIRDSKRVNDFQKRFILYITDIKRITTFALIILLAYFFKPIIPFDKDVDSSRHILNILFFSTELIINLLMIMSTIKTIKLFRKTLKLNIDSDYYYEEYYKYVKKCLDSINKNNKNISLKNRIERKNNKQINKYIEENSKYYSLDETKFDRNKYVQIKANNSGIFEKYNITALQDIVDKIDELIKNKKELTIDNSPIVIFLLKPDIKINHGISIAYLRKDFIDIEDDLQKTINFQNGTYFQDEELNLILNDLYTLTLYKNNKIFNNYDMLIDFYNYLNDNNMRNSLNLAYEYIGEMILKCEKKSKQREFASILSTLIMIAYSNKDYEYYKKLSYYMYYFYKMQLPKSKDIRSTIYEYTNQIFSLEYYSARDKEDKEYYDVMMSNILNIIFDLLEMKEFDAICDIFENLHFKSTEFVMIDSEEVTDCEITKLQFTFGFVYSLIILQNKKIFNAKDVEAIKRIINYIENGFVNIYDVEDTIYYFKEYFNKTSNVQSAYNRLDFRFINKKYRNSWSGVCIDYNFVLITYIYLFNINYSTGNIKYTTLVSRNNKYYFENLINIVNANITKDSIEYLLGINYNNEVLLKKLNMLLDSCKEKEEEYKITNKIESNIFNEFYGLLVQEINKGNELINYLKKSKLVVKSKNESRKMFGINQIIDRNIFFEENHSLSMIAENFAYAMIKGISDAYIDKLEKVSTEYQGSIKEFINTINEKDYIIITNRMNIRKLGEYNYNSNKATINGKEFKIILEPKAKKIYIMRKQDVPRIKFNSILEKGLETKNKIYYKIIDCSKNKACREELMSNTDWIKELGDKNTQDTYLKGKCLIKVFMSVEIIKNDDSVINNFVCSKGD